MTKELTVVAIGDLHAGSRVAVCPPDSPTADGGIYHPSPAQLALYRDYKLLTTQWANPDVLICNGDMIEGQARKESGVPCWSNDLDDQLRAAATLIKMWNAKEIYMINGTGYHVDAGGKSLENTLGKKVGAKLVGPNEDDFSSEEVFVKVGGLTFHACHHISIGTGWYKTTPLARELVFALLNETDFYKVDVILRSHVHYFVGVEFHRQRGYIIPCWQLRTRYMIKKSSFGMTPSIGALRFRIKDGSISLDKAFFRPEEARPVLHEFGKGS